jgi:outer membrane protein assembly factor BamB
MVWHNFQVAGPHGGVGGIFAPAYNEGVVYALVQRPTIFSVVALDASTGEEIWNTVIYQDFVENAELHALANNSSIVFYDGLLFLGTAGTDSFNFSHPSFFILEAESGEVIKKTTVIPREKWLDGYAGGGIWATAVVDRHTGYLYVGTANPYNKRKEYKYTNAIIKVDLNRASKRFGEIVDGYRGDKDYDPKLYNTPQCKYLGETQPVWYSGFCGQKDIDFGASPSLYKDSNGDSIVAELQKSCTMHAVRTDSMERLWKHKKLAVGGLSGCAGGSAYDDRALYIGVNEGVMYALDKDTGETLWKSKYRDAGSNYHPVSVAGGLVFTIGNNGNLYALDNKTGRVVFKEQLQADGITCSATQSAGVSIVGDTVLVACDSAEGESATSAVFAYRLRR